MNIITDMNYFTGKRAFSHDYATENRPPEVVNLLRKKTQATAHIWCVIGVI